MADGVAVLQPDGSNVRGVVRFIDERGGLRISYRVTGLTDGEHGFHIHEYGDLTDGCKSACAHFNPDGMTHGGLDTAVRHFGDLGNITSSKSVAEGELFLPNGRLDTSRYGILGRMIIVHADRDDLGMGGDEESLKTGNAGKRLACGVIGLADPDTDTMTMDAESTSLATLGVGVAAAGLGFLAGRRDSRTLEAPYQPDQEISDYTPRDLATSSAITGDFTTDSLKYGFGPTSLSAEDEEFPDWVDNFLPGPNINPHDDPAYDEPYDQCESTFPDGSHCPDPARTGPFHYSQGYIGKVTACRECWDDILEGIEEGVRQGIDGFGDDSVGEVTSTGDDTFDDDFREEFAAEDDYDATYGKAQAKIRRRLKNKLMGEATMGTKAGEWSARKSQELKRRYEAACERKGIKPYKGSKTSKQKDLSAWSKQGWRTASGRKSSVTGEPYFPAKAVKALKDKELYAKAKRQKAAATRAGKQRATYSKDIQAVVARYRAEDDHTIDDLDSDTLINRMDAIGVLMDEIVRKHGNSYEKAERDPTYLRLASQHNALARAYARREGFSAEDFTIEEPPMDIEEEAQARLEAIRQLQWGVRVIERMLREGNIDDAREFARITVEAMRQEEEAARDLGLDPDRFSAEDEDLQVCYNCKTTREERSVLPHRLSRGETKTTRKLGLCYDCGGCYDCCELICEPDDVKADHGFEAESDASFTPEPDLPLTEQARDQYMFMMPDGSALWIHNQDWSVGMADMKPTWDSKRLSDYGGTPTTVTYMSLGPVDPADYTDFIPEWRPGMSFPPEDMVDQWIDPSRLGGAHNEFTKQYETGFWPGLSLREILGKYDGGKPVFDAESDDDEFEYPHHDPDWLYDHHIVQGLSARRIAEMLDVPVNLITRRIHEFGLYVPGEYTADRRMTENELRRMRERRAEDDPVSRIAAGTNDALADFANAHDTDDGYYFAGGLIGGLLIAVAGNIISDRLQDWWRSRSA